MKIQLIAASVAVLSVSSVMPLGAAPEKGSAASEQTETVVTIGGQVRRPGPVPFRKDLTIYAAVQAAGGGATEFGSMRRVKVIRDGKVETHDLTKDDTKSVLLQKNDTIEVPQKNLLGR
ncbi:MAG: hypothetical protein EOP85_06890 [Verrucomicrobiaceae bacterium]|nr:MAG: hypothetical protein EOP85_06890 [Verrucomicrobiaceae bacterium]